MMSGRSLFFVGFGQAVISLRYISFMQMTPQECTTGLFLKHCGGTAIVDSVR
jgi:hypothetical protein